MEVSPNGWCTMGHPTKMDDLGLLVPPFCGDLHMKLWVETDIERFSQSCGVTLNLNTVGSSEI